MMMKTNGDQNPFSVPHGALPPPPNFMPSQHQWNMTPGPNGTNVYFASSPWNVSQPGQQNFPPPNTYQWNAQPIVTGQNISNGNITQVTGEAAWYQTFIKGKPRALGITLIVAAVCHIIFGICLPFAAMAITFYSGIQYWGPIFYIIAGSFTNNAQQKPTIGLVKLSYGFSIFSSIISVVAMIVNILDFVYLRCYHYSCYDELNAAYGIVSIIFLLHALVFCVTVSVSVFGGRALVFEPANVPQQVVVIQNMMPVPAAAYTANPSATPTSPPPYNT